VQQRRSGSSAGYQPRAGRHRGGKARICEGSVRAFVDATGRGRYPSVVTVTLTLDTVKTGTVECTADIPVMNGLLPAQGRPDKRGDILVAMKRDSFAPAKASGSDSAGTGAKCIQARQDRLAMVQRAICSR
jgi:hypothetical protein